MKKIFFICLIAILILSCNISSSSNDSSSNYIILNFGELSETQILTLDNYKYYKIVIPEDKSDIKLVINSTSPSGHILRYYFFNGETPSLSNWQFSGSIVIPQTYDEQLFSDEFTPGESVIIQISNSIDEDNTQTITYALGIFESI